MITSIIYSFPPCLAVRLVSPPCVVYDVLHDVLRRAIVPLMVGYNHHDVLDQSFRSDTCHV